MSIEAPRASMSGDLSVDTDTIDQVHARLHTKTRQLAARQQVINDAAAYARDIDVIPVVKAELLAILARDCDEL